MALRPSWLLPGGLRPAVEQAQLRADVGELEEPDWHRRRVGKERERFTGPEATADQLIDGVAAGIWRLRLHAHDPRPILYAPS